MMQKILLPLLVVLGFTSCATKSINYARTLPTGVEVIANELDREMYGDKDNQIAFTSLVNLDDFKKSNKFGRLFSESLMTQMALRGFNVVEYRGDGIVTKNKKGEFKLNRSRVRQIKDKHILVLVGTYSQMDDNIIVNVRVVDNESDELVSAASVFMPLKKQVDTLQIIPSPCNRTDPCWNDTYGNTSMLRHRVK